MNEKTKQHFDDLLSQYDRFHVFMHKVPDPDAMGSALAMKKVIMSIKPDVQEIKIFGQPVDRPQNKTIVSALNLIFQDPSIALETYKKEQEEGNEHTPICKIFVDCDGKSGNSNFGVKPDWVVDHHMDKYSSDVDPSVDLRPYGSCSTILVDYIQAYDVQLVHEDPSDASLATALLVGIMTDTKNLVSDSMTEHDWSSFRYLQPLCDREKLHQVLNYEIPASYYELGKIAWDNHKIVGSLLVINLGYITSSTRGGISYVADGWKSYRGMDTVIVFGVYGKVIVVSCRVKSGGPIKANDLVRDLFKIDNGTAGGHPESAGGDIPLKWLNPGQLTDDNKQKLLDVLTDYIVSEACEITDTKR
jgi:nanoRNase/pAp phosphatase (c-di-AMP/oligoRNAs hydrolase)